MKYTKIIKKKVKVAVLSVTGSIAGNGQGLPFRYGIDLMQSNY